MRRAITLFLLILKFASCSNIKTSSVEMGTNPKDSLKQRFIPHLNGDWVLTDYINSIEQNKSPLKSSSKLKGIVTLTFNNEINSDSIEVGASWNNHEGYNFTVYFIEGQNPHSLKTNLPDYDLKTNYYELGYKRINNDTFLFLYHYDQSSKLIDSKKFTKVPSNQKDLDAARGIQRIVNEKLFAGTYLFIDNKNSSTKIQLNNDGTLTGLPGMQTYYVSTDFLGDPEAIHDEIAFNLNEKNSTWYAYKIENDTTFLYHITNQNGSESAKLGKMAYKLVRQNGVIK